MERRPQNLANHAKYDPWFHYFALPAITVVFLLNAWRCVAEFSRWNLYAAILTFALIVLAFKTRLNALRVQDRVIRLEERLRLKEVLPEGLRGRIGELAEPQLIALRFAPDEELAELVAKTLQNRWDQKQIKQAIKNWRPDYFRV